jgi:hypothetical protein
MKPKLIAIADLRLFWLLYQLLRSDWIEKVRQLVSFTRLNSEWLEC